MSARYDIRYYGGIFFKKIILHMVSESKSLVCYFDTVRELKSAISLQNWREDLRLDLVIRCPAFLH